MKNTKIKGFSLAELMIAMLVISVALAAAAPSITKTLSGGDAIWKASTDATVDKDGNEVFTEDASQLYFNGPNILVGAQRLHNLRGIKEYFKDAPDRSGFHFSPKTDKLVIFNNIANSANANSFMTSSHLSFYNKDGGKDVYAGRLAADRYNLALGIGALQSLVPNPTNTDELHRGQYNTAIGQYALLTNATGSYNTALGYKALQGTPAGSGKATQHASNSIAIGDNALRNNVGKNNIAIGSHAGTHLEGDNNLVIGNGAGYRLTGSNNLLINSTVSFNPDATNNNVKDLLRGHRSTTSYPVIDDDDNFSIGVVDYRMYRDNNAYYRPPVIQGFTRTKTCSSGDGCADGVKHAKGIIINTNRFNVKSANGKTTIFSVNSTDFTKESTTDPLSLLKNLGSSRIKKRIDSSAHKTSYYNYLTKTFNMLEATEFERPCNGAPICLAQFDVMTASYYSKGDTNSGIAGNLYDRTHTFPSYVTSEKNGTKLPMPVYDLFIGSLVPKDDYLKIENDRRSEVKGSHSGNALYLIDVGQVRHNSGLYNHIHSRTKPYDGPARIVSKQSLKLRTVKVSMNFLEEFKETSGAIDYLRSNLKDFLKCLLHGKDEFSCSNTGNTANEKSFIQELLSPEIRCPYLEDTTLLKYIFGCGEYSDARLKNISGDNLAGLDEINKLNVVNYTYKADKAKTPHVGVIAQELKTVFPDAVKKGSDGYYRIRLEDMFYAMINSVKELSARKNDLETLTTDYIDTPLAELQKQNADIKAQNELIKQKNAEMEKRISKLETK